MHYGHFPTLKSSLNTFCASLTSDKVQEFAAGAVSAPQPPVAVRSSSDQSFDNSRLGDVCDRFDGYCQCAKHKFTKPTGKTFEVSTITWAQE